MATPVNTITLKYPTDWYCQAMVDLMYPNLAIGQTFYTDLSAEFKGTRHGATAKVRVPSRPTVDDFVASAGVTYQAVTETSVTLTLDKFKAVPIAMDSQDLTLELDQWAERVGKPAARELAKQINADCADIYKCVPYQTGITSAIPFASDVTAATNARKILQNNEAWDQGNMYFVMDPNAEANALALAVFNQANTSSDGARTQREGDLGRKFGFQMLCDQQLKTHTPGVGTAGSGGASAFYIKASSAAAVTTISASSFIGALTVSEGDLITITHTTYGAHQYVVTADGAASAMAIYPALAHAVVSGDFVACAGYDVDGTALNNYVNNLAYAKDAFSLHWADLDTPPPGTAGGGVYRDPKTGVSIRLTIGWDNKYLCPTWVWSCLYGIDYLNREKAVRVISSTG